MKDFVLVDDFLLDDTSNTNVDFNYENGIFNQIELEITLDCNVSCNNCNRMCGVFDFGDTHMTVRQIQRFISELTYLPHHVKALLVIGGEPLVHPQFLEIWFLLYDKLVQTKIIEEIRLFTNGILQLPKEIEKCKYKLICSPPKQKKHFAFFVAPVDVKGKLVRCLIPKNCGIALNTFGYFPCGPAGSLYRLFNLDLAKMSLPKSLSEWNYNDICIYCSHAFAWSIRSKWAEEDSRNNNLRCSSTFYKKIKEVKEMKYNIPKYPESNLYLL